jgi:DNA (cytosine-5)-methyltransferase 1
MKYLSVCSGIEAATVAWHPLGWEPLGFAEIEPFPAAVLAHHYPHVPNFGDMNAFKDWPDAAIDVLVGGTPCQSFSVAGLRKGLADPRGNLCLTYLAIADKYRPEWIIWENVPGVLSSSDGRDFGAFIGGLGQLGYHASWRVLDAQYVRVDGFGRAVPQRRRRVFVVGHLGDWRRAAAVLFERESLHGHTPPRRQEGQGVAPTISARPTGGGGLGTDFDLDGGLVAKPILAGGHANNPLDENLVPSVIPLMDAAKGRTDERGSRDGSAIGDPGDPMYALRAGSQHGIAVPMAFAENSRAELRLCGGDGSVAAQLTTGGGKPGQGQPCIAFDWRASPSRSMNPDEISDTLSGRADRAVAFSITPSNSNADYNAREAHKSQAITSNGNRPSARGGDLIATTWAVRRLTPLECERLQAFPDGYTAVPYRKKPAADGPRYKALGNSMAANAMRWLGRRIDLVAAITPCHPVKE